MSSVLSNTSYDVLFLCNLYPYYYVTVRTVGWLRNIIYVRQKDKRQSSYVAFCKYSNIMTPLLWII